MGPQLWLENLDLGSTVHHRMRQLMSLCLKTFGKGCYLFTDAWIHLPRLAIKCLSDPGGSNSQSSHVSLPSVPSSAPNSARPSMVCLMKFSSG